jgi:hypothetical protein
MVLCITCSFVELSLNHHVKFQVVSFVLILLCVPFNGIMDDGRFLFYVYLNQIGKLTRVRVMKNADMKLTV